LTRQRSRTAVAALLAVTLTGCGMRLPFFSSASSGPYFATKLCGVRFDGKSKVARLHLTLDVVRPLPRGALVETEFHDVAERTVHTASRVVSGSERTVELVSPPIAQVRAYGYKTVTRVYASSERGEALGSHAHLCQSLLDQRDLGPQFR
jgi:hypothetical protein